MLSDKEVFRIIEDIDYSFDLVCKLAEKSIENIEDRESLEFFRKHKKIYLRFFSDTQVETINGLQNQYLNSGFYFEAKCSKCKQGYKENIQL